MGSWFNDTEKPITIIHSFQIEFEIAIMFLLAVAVAISLLKPKKEQREEKVVVPVIVTKQEKRLYALYKTYLDCNVEVKHHDKTIKSCVTFVDFKGITLADGSVIEYNDIQSLY